MDPHEGLPCVQKSLSELRAWELQPFAQLSHVADAVMTAHILVKSVDPLQCATLSPKILTELLRKDLGFDGLVFSDSLVMQGLLDSSSSIEEAAIRSILAGCDLLILGGKQLNASQKGFELTVEDNLRIHQAIVKVVQRGRIPMDRIDESYARILKSKQKYLYLQLSQ